MLEGKLAYKNKNALSLQENIQLALHIEVETLQQVNFKQLRITVTSDV